MHLVQKSLDASRLQSLITSLKTDSIPPGLFSREIFSPHYSGSEVGFFFAKFGRPLCPQTRFFFHPLLDHFWTLTETHCEPL